MTGLTSLPNQKDKIWKQKKKSSITRNNVINMKKKFCSFKKKGKKNAGQSCVRHTGDNSALCDHGRAYLDKENK